MSRPSAVASIRLSPSVSVLETAVGVILRTDQGSFALEGRHAELFTGHILPLLDGQHNRDSIVDHLSQYSPTSVRGFLSQLEEQGLLVEAPGGNASPTRSPSSRHLEFFRHWFEQPEEAVERLRMSRVLLVGLEPWGIVAALDLARSGLGELFLLDDRLVDADMINSTPALKDGTLGKPRREAVRALLASQAPGCGVTAHRLELDAFGNLVAEAKRVDLILIALARDEMRVLSAVARFAHKAGIRYLPAHLEGWTALLGPAVQPGEVACWNCYRLRSLANQPEPLIAHSVQQTLLAARQARRAPVDLPPMVPLVGHLLALEAIKMVTDYAPSRLFGRVMVQDLVDLDVSYHRVVRMPWCEVCGGAIPVKGLPAQGTLDLPLEPEALVNRLSEWVDPRTGIIRSLTIVPPRAGEPELPIVAMAELAEYTEGIPNQFEQPAAIGKGTTQSEALIGAAGEAMERYSAGRCRLSELLRCPQGELEGDFLDPRDAGLYEEHQYGKASFPFTSYDSDMPLSWVPGRWLHDDTEVWLPADLVYLGAHSSTVSPLCQQTSNGLACAATAVDAERASALELLERDAFMITWLARLPGIPLVHDQVIDAECREIVHLLEARGARTEMYLLDAGQIVPVVACLTLGDGKDWPGLAMALGADIDPLVAIRKAVLEQGQVAPHIRRLMQRPGVDGPKQPGDVLRISDHALYYARRREPDELRFLRDTPYAAVRDHDLGSFSLGSWSECVSALADAGIRIAVADVTAPDIVSGPFRVARSVGINVQPLHFGYEFRRRPCARLRALAPGRLNPDPHPLA